MTILMGVSQVDITPTHPVPLAGFANRKGNMEGIHSKLYIKIFLFNSNGHQALIIIGDLIWWDGKLVEKWKKKIYDRFSINPSAVCFHATHNHSGPQTSDQFTPSLGVHDENYIATLENEIFKGIDKAYENEEEIICKIIKSNCSLGVNRRKKEAGRIIMQPNLEGTCDSDLSIVLFENKNKQIKGILVHYSCHPTCTDANVLSSEFTGQCCSIIGNHFPTAVVGFLQGCCGEIRPSIIKEGAFYKGSVKDMENFGDRLAERIIDEIAIGGQELELSNQIYGEIKSVPLIFRENYRSSEAFSSLPEVLDEWKLLKKKYKKFVNLEMQKISIGGKLILFGFNGEMVQEYGLFLKKQNPNILPIGYTNGMIGYVPTASQLEEGGYEAEDFIYYFGLPAPFQTEIEGNIKREIKNMIKGE